MRSAAARKMERMDPKRGLKGKEPLAEPLNLGQFNGSRVPLSGNALFTYKLLSGKLHTGSAPKQAEKPEKPKCKTKDKAADGVDVSQFEDRVMW